MAGRIAVIDRHDIGAGGLTDLAVFGIGLIGDFAQDLLAHLARGEFQRKAVGERAFHRWMVQEAGMDQTAQQRLGLDHLGGLIADARPDRIDRCQFCFDFCHDHLPVRGEYNTGQYRVTNHVGVWRRLGGTQPPPRPSRPMIAGKAGGWRGPQRPAGGLLAPHRPARGPSGCHCPSADAARQSGA